MGATPSDAQLLAKLGKVAPRITKRETDLAGDYAERMAIWRELLDRGVARSTIADASGVTVSAINYQLRQERIRQG